MKRRTIRSLFVAAFLVLGAAALVNRVGDATAGPPEPQTQLAANERTAERDHRLRDKQAATHKPTAEPEKAASNAFSIECEWIGKRVVNLLLRDDALAANDFMPFYEGFSCDRDHLSRAFGCAVVNDSVTDGEARIQRVNACWRDPSIRLPLAEKNAPAAGKPNVADKPIDKPAATDAPAAKPADKPTDPAPAKPAPAPTPAPGGAQKGG